MQPERFAYLFQRYLDKSSSAEERNEFIQAVYDEQNSGELDKLSADALDNYITDKQLSAYEADELFESIRKRAAKTYPAVHRVHFLRTAWFRYAAAIFIIVGIGAYLWSTNKKEPVTIVQSNGVKNILPGGDRAILTLADGSTIVLDSASDGQLAIQGNSKIIKTSTGQLIYESYGQPIPSMGGVDPGAGIPHGKNSGPGSGVGRGEASYNTMSTPRGGQYQLTLPDGSKVWLNSASSITYPTVFTTTREVSITGEAYFEISPNKSIPFILKTISDKIEVLGTSFNINAYPDEPSVKTSLVSGSVKIKPAFAKASAGKESILKPGEAFINNRIIKTNLAHDLAWKNGYFSFEKTSLQSVMRQLSRWYNVDIIYEGNIPERTFSGEIGRSLTLEQVLKGLSKTKINYRVESGNRIIILP